MNNDNLVDKYLIAKDNIPYGILWIPQGTRLKVTDDFRTSGHVANIWWDSGTIYLDFIVQIDDFEIEGTIDGTFKERILGFFKDVPLISDEQILEVFLNRQNAISEHYVSYKKELFCKKEKETNLISKSKVIARWWLNKNEIIIYNPNHLITEEKVEEIKKREIKVNWFTEPQYIGDKNTIIP